MQLRIKEYNLFVATSGTLYEELDLLQVNQETCSEMIEKSLLQSELACEHPSIDNRWDFGRDPICVKLIRRNIYLALFPSADYTANGS